MRARSLDHNKATILRLKGYSYSEIAKKLNVSKSTLSLWLRNVVLSNDARQNILVKKRNGQLKGALGKSESRKKREIEIITHALHEINVISQRELWLLGVMAYWCEGAKQRKGNISQRVVFSNSDPFLVTLFVKWLKDICLIDDNDISYSIYIHENGNIGQAINYWEGILALNTISLRSIIIKKNKTSINRNYKDISYYGQMRIVVSKSTDLNRKIKGWTLGINDSLK